jgi:RNA polymerase subunit RPABC4/transcription elongation factor Spt4
VWQCGWCWLYVKRYQEMCPYCGAECIVMVEEEDVVNNCGSSDMRNDLGDFTVL